jgi:hypothetical protein
MTIIILAIAAVQPLQEDPFGLRYGGWMMDLSGKVKSSTAALPGTLIDLSTTLGIDEPERPANHATAWLNLPFIGRINGSYWAADFEGEQSLPTSLTFAGQNYTQNTMVTTNMDLVMFGATLETRILPLVYLNIGSYFLDAEVEMTTTSFGSNAKVNTPIPVAGLRVGGELTQYVHLEFMFLATSISNIGNSSGRYLDFRSELAVKVLANLAITGGYRATSLFGKKDGSDEAVVDIELKGIFVGVGISF